MSVYAIDAAQRVRGMERELPPAERERSLGYAYPGEQAYIHTLAKVCA